MYVVLIRVGCRVRTHSDCHRCAYPILQSMLRAAGHHGDQEQTTNETAAAHNHNHQYDVCARYDPECEQVERRVAIVCRSRVIAIPGAVGAINPDVASYEPHEQETADNAIERIGANVLLIPFTQAVYETLNQTANLLNHTDNAANQQIDGYEALQWTLIEVCQTNDDHRHWYDQQ